MSGNQEGDEQFRKYQIRQSVTKNAGQVLKNAKNINLHEFIQIFTLYFFNPCQSAKFMPWVSAVEKTKPIRKSQVHNLSHRECKSAQEEIFD